MRAMPSRRRPAEAASRLRHRLVDVAPASHRRLQLSRPVPLLRHVLHVRSPRSVHRHPARTSHRVAVPAYLPREEICTSCLLPDALPRASSGRRTFGGLRLSKPDQEHETEFWTEVRRNVKPSTLAGRLSRPCSNAGSAFGWHQSSAGPGPRTPGRGAGPAMRPVPSRRGPASGHLRLQVGPTLASIAPSPTSGSDRTPRRAAGCAWQSPR
jgi:hypothetical protein